MKFNSNIISRAIWNNFETELRCFSGSQNQYSKCGQLKNDSIKNVRVHCTE